MPYALMRGPGEIISLVGSGAKPQPPEAYFSMLAWQTARKPKRKNTKKGLDGGGASI